MNNLKNSWEENVMFENAGSKALSIVKVYVVFELIVTFIIGLIYCVQYATVTRYSMYSEYNGSSNFNFGKFLIALLILVLIMFFEYVMGIFMVAFCQMMEDVHYLKEQKESSDCKYNVNGVLKSEADRESEIIAKGGWKCPGCNRIHPAYETSCMCGRAKGGN